MQDNTCIHVDVGAPLVMGRGVTIGHGVVLHGVEIGDYALVGMGAIMLGGARIGAHLRQLDLTGAARLADRRGRSLVRRKQRHLDGRVVG